MPRRPHHVESAVRAAKAPPSPPILIAHDDPFFAPSPEELEGRLTVLTHREFKIVVPHAILDGWRLSKEPKNPVNQLGGLLAIQVPVVTSNDRSSLFAAFNKRLNTVHVDDVEDASFQEAATIISTFRQFDPIDENFEDRQTWLKTFSGEKKARMEKGLREAFDLTARELSAKDISVKVEALLKRDDPEWAPRIICAGTDAYNAVTGPMAMITMKRLLQLLDLQMIGPVKFKLGYRCSDVALAQFLKESPHTHLAEGDYSRNDREQRRKVHKLYSLVLRKLGLPKWYIRLEEQLSVFTVKSRSFGLFATIMNQLPTGATITTTRNSIYNMLMFAVSCQRQRLTASALVLGDDLLALTSRRIDCEKWVNDVATFRMVLKAKVPNFDGEATFLSRRLIIRDVETPCTVPLLGKAIARFNVRANNNQSVSDDQYLAGKCLSYAYEFRHVPFVCAYFLKRYDMIGVDLKIELEMTWFTRSNGVNQNNVMQFIRDEKVKLSDDQFLNWSMQTYGLGLCDWDEILGTTVLEERAICVSHPEEDRLRIDF